MRNIVRAMCDNEWINKNTTNNTLMCRCITNLSHQNKIKQDEMIELKYKNKGEVIKSKQRLEINCNKLSTKIDKYFKLDAT